MYLYVICIPLYNYHFNTWKITYKVMIQTYSISDVFIWFVETDIFKPIHENG